MKFLLYSLNFAPELTGIGKYNGELVESLVKHGTEATVLCAPPYYPEWEVHSGHRANRYLTEKLNGATVHRCPLYVPRRVTTLKRLLHLFSFAVSSGLRLLTLLRLRPDVVFLVQPTLFCAPMALLYCRLTGARAVMHVQDYELDAMIGLGLAGSVPLARVLQSIETWFLSRFDVVSTISYSMLERARRKGVSKERTLLFPNWANIDFVTPQTPGGSFRKRIGLSERDKVVLYAGNMGEKQGLEIILDAAKTFRSESSVKFMLVGAGAQLERLRQYARDSNLDNVSFLPLQPWEDVPAMLAMADIHLIIQKKGAADAVLPSKLTNILAAGGNAIITAEHATELGNLVREYPGIFELIEPENTEALVLALQRRLCQNRADHNRVARAYAETRLDRNAVIQRFVNQIGFEWRTG